MLCKVQELIFLKNFNIFQAARLEEYAGQYGDAMDLSEKHLARFMLNALPDESETDVLSAGQSGEGFYIPDDIDKSCYALGGEYLTAASGLAVGVCADCGYTLLFTAPGARGHLPELCILF